jgi:bifunctional UDP-N-acetylglucosamine pyrophosphorylase/glucosamine-1-phosphate N-acetyltransferase
MSQSIAGIILAAGKGTRMKSELPKVLHEVCGLPMVEHVGRGLKAAGVQKPIVVVGYGGDGVIAKLGDSYDFAWQREQLGTGHAVQQTLPLLAGHDGPVVIAYGDTPLIGVEVFEELIRVHLASGALGTLASSIMPDPTGYGRIVRGSDAVPSSGPSPAAGAAGREGSP